MGRVTVQTTFRTNELGKSAAQEVQELISRHRASLAETLNGMRGDLSRHAASQIRYIVEQERDLLGKALRTMGVDKYIVRSRITGLTDLPFGEPYGAYAYRRVQVSIEVADPDLMEEEELGLTLATILSKVMKAPTALSVTDNPFTLADRENIIQALQKVKMHDKAMRQDWTRVLEEDGEYIPPLEVQEAQVRHETVVTLQEGRVL